ncbi:hypothetical protein PV328_008993 [Microctonus aethiopoides]|uniref:Kazal-like domain-containing protein n=1 Tax=Microctonus aethiopoides TaxID=144406 RepID=A0AA39FKK2_9HYME|nr:hypothetical protein PV328_008993 [Microctonus aethiopoides]
MATGPMRSEIEGGLSGPANPIPDQSLDCGCSQLPCPKLVKFATRKIFVGLVCWIGIVQAAAQAYYGLTSSTMARKFQILPSTLEWISLITDGIFPFILALPVAYWGDRIHRAAWTGALVLIQSVGFIIFIIPHFTQPSSRVIEETINTTHQSLYADENPELCFVMGLARMSINKDDSYIMALSIIIIVQVLNCMGNIAYFTFTISYLDDNTRKRHVAILISFIIAMKIVGVLFGYLLAWGCLRIDADDLNSQIESYREQIGAWWLGWPILSICLAIGGVPMSWMPRRLTSEVVEQAAASILDLAGRTSPISESTISNETKYGDTEFFKSLIRLVKNKILMCNIFASVFCTVALVNFANNEDIYLESRFYVPRPTGLYLGFSDPLLSRIISIILRPIIIGLIIIISGIIIVKYRPRAKYIVGYNIIICIIAVLIMITLAFLSCKKPPIVGTNRDGSISLLRYCNKNCRCSEDANFSPICDNKNLYTFYTPCHAGCTNVDDTGDVKKFSGCNCIEEITGLHGNNEAIQGPCGSITCQYGWIVFEISTIITYSLIASGAVGSFIIGLRSIYIQDKALAIGLWITFTSIFVYIIGKMIYWQLAEWTCIQRGHLSSQCHLHDSKKLGSYLAYLTAILLTIGIVFELMILFLCKSLRLYRDTEVNLADVIANPTQAIPLMNNEGEAQQEICPGNLDFNSSNNGTASANVIAPSVRTKTNQVNDNDTVATVELSQVHSENQKVNGPVQYGNIILDDRPGTIESFVNKEHSPMSDTDFTDDDELKTIKNKRTPMSLSAISYRRLEVDSDAESNISSVNNNDLIKSSRDNETLQQNANPSTIINHTVAGFSRTNDIEFTKFAKNPNLRKNKNERPYTGDFNEVGIPIVNYPLTSMNSRSIGSVLMAAKLTKDHREESLANDDGIQRSLSPAEHTSSGFGSSASDLNKITTKQKDEIYPEKKSNRKNLPAFSTAL